MHARIRSRAITRELWELRRKSLTPLALEIRRQRFEGFVFPYVGSRPIASITAPELLTVLKRIEARSLHETAHRVRSESGQVFRYAIATGRAERDITSDLRGALAPVVVKNHAAITEPTRIGELLRAIDSYLGQPASEYVLKLAPLLFVRPGELRQAQAHPRISGREPAAG